MPFYTAKNNKSRGANARKKNYWKTSQTFMFKEKAWSKRVIWREPKCTAMVPSSLLFGTPRAPNSSLMLKATIYTKPGHVVYVMYILVMSGIKGQ